MGVISSLMHNPEPLGTVDDILRPAGDNPVLERGFVTTSAAFATAFPTLIGTVPLGTLVASVAHRITDLVQ